MSRRVKRRMSLMCVVVMALLIPTASALDFPISGTIPDGIVYEDGVYTVSGPLPAGDGFHIIRDAEVDFVTGAVLPAYNYLGIVDDAVVNIYDIDCEMGSGTLVSIEGSTNTAKYNADVTLHGASFEIDGVDATSEVLPNGALFVDGQYFLPWNVVSAYDENGQLIYEITVSCVETLFPEGYVRTFVKLGGGGGIIDVDIDIKPESVDNTINLGSMGVIPVGILSTADFDATQVDPWTVELAGAGVAVRGKGSKLLSSEKDLNGDGLMDLEVKVETENLDPDSFQDGAAILKGMTYDGLEIQGSDLITVVPIQ